MTSLNDLIRRNVANVRERICRAEERSGRESGSARLVAVTKYSSCDDGVLPALLNAGCSDFGENRASLFLKKVETFPTGIRWHFIGGLQRNKVRRVLPFVSLIHSVDSVRLAEAIDRILDEENDPNRTSEQNSNERTLDDARIAEDEKSRNFVFPSSVSVLLEVHISNDANKSGFEPDELLDRLGELFAFPRLKICGLMGMGGLDSTASEVRRQFASLRSLGEKCRSAYPDRIEFRELSMGMSDDFEIAIEEGATLVRLGSILLRDSA